MKDELTVLGYKVRHNQISPTQERIQDIHNFPVPQTVKELRSFLGLLSYCRNFTKDLGAKSAPLNELLKGSPPPNSKLDLSPEQLTSFNELKGLINDTARLRLPDYKKPFVVITNASSRKIGGILAQVSDYGVEEAVSYFSRTTSESQAKYSATHLELLAVVETLRHFRPYLIHRKFKLKTDHKALLALKHTKNQDSLLFRWSLFLSEFDFDIEYVKGELNPADALSRADPPMINALSNPSRSLIIDDAVKNRLVESYHLNLGHGSASNMIYNLGKKFNWPGLYTDVHKYVAGCQTCLKAGKIVPNSNFHTITTSAPGELIVIDTVGPLPCTTKGNKFILTAVDHFSKIAFAKPVQHKTAQNVFLFITETILKVSPNAKHFLSDNGLEFKSSEVIEKLKTLGVRWKFGSPYHPQTQGAVERFNHTIIQKIKKLSNFKPHHWDLHVHPAVQAYNWSFHRAINCSPHEMFSGHIPVFKTDEGLLSQQFTPQITSHYLKTRREAIRGKYENEFSGTVTAKTKFKEGDSVLKYNYAPTLTKLDPQWEPGFIVNRIKQDGKSAVISKNGVSYTANKIHLRLDTSATPFQEGGNVGLPPTSSIEST
ncbi:hypothetical protein PAEPH01_1922 [Pancytospora epiphaga]|nr:hypothetical protein PAEPH01_1922 [Pancytospora epiphaga]